MDLSSVETAIVVPSIVPSIVITQPLSIIASLKYAKHLAVISKFFCSALPELFKENLERNAPLLLTLEKYA